MALRDFERAVASRDFGALHRLLARPGQLGETPSRLSARLAHYVSELDQRSRDLHAALIAGVPPRVDVPLRGGGGLPCAEDSDGWRVASAGIGPVWAATPVDAARAFRAALLRRGSADLLQTFSSRARGSAEADTQSLLDALEDPGSLRLNNISPEHANFELPDGRQLILVREGGYWRVDDLR